MPRWPPLIFSPPRFTATGTTPSCPDSSQTDAVIRAQTLKASDVQHLTIKDPSGAVLAENRSEPLDRAKAQVLFFTGRKRPASGWIRGTYQAAYTVSRDGGTIIDFRFDRHL